MLRKLKIEDASLMLEWMHDESVVRDLSRDFGSMKIENCEAFIKQAIADGEKPTGEYEDIHFAIVEDGSDEYMGTVSIKNIEWDESRGEFAITIRKCAMGRGLSISGMRDILEYAHNVMNLKTVYWYVSKHNERAIRFYDKNGFKRTDIDELGLKQDIIENVSEMLWYKDETPEG